MVKFVLPETPLVGSVAVTVTVPVSPEVVLRTPVVESMLTPATLPALTVHVTSFVTTTCWPLAVAVATKDTGLPDTIEKFAGVTLIAVILESVTVMVAVPLTVPAAPVITDFPGETPITIPFVEPTVATLVDALLQKMPEVTAFVLPSLYVPVAVIWSVLLCWMVAVGPTAILVNVGLTKKPLHPMATPSSKTTAQAAIMDDVRSNLAIAPATSKIATQQLTKL